MFDIESQVTAKFGVCVKEFVTMIIYHAIVFMKTIVQQVKGIRLTCSYKSPTISNVCATSSGNLDHFR